MATYQIYVDESNQLGESLLAYLRSIPQVVTFGSKEVEEVITKKELLDDLNAAFRDVRLKMDGKRKRKTAYEFLEEIRSSK